MVPGTRGTGNETFWNGRIDEVGIWKRALTDQEHSDLYNAGAGNTLNSSGFALDAGGALTDQLVAYWKLDETSGTRVDSEAALVRTVEGESRFIYDSLDRLTQAFYPDGFSEVFTYDAVRGLGTLHFGTVHWDR